MDLVNLKPTGTGWEFVTEADLEDFVWANLNQLFGLTPLKYYSFFTKTPHVLPSLQVSSLHKSEPKFQ